ncbi:MAG: flippase [bacterium]
MNIIIALSRRIPWLSQLDQHMKEVVRGASVAFILRLLGVGLGFGFNVLLARLLGAKGAGIYYLALTVVTISTIFGRLGLGNALLRFVADSSEQGDWAKVAGAYRQGIKIAAGAAAVVTVVVFLGASWIAEHVFAKPNLAAPLRLMTLSVWPLSLVNIYAELLKGLKKIRDAVFIQAAGIPIISLPVLALIGSRLGVNGAVAAYLFATVVVLALGYFLWRRATLRIKGVAGHFDTRLLVSTSLPLFWVALMNWVIGNADTVILGMLANSKLVGVYGAALRVSMLTSFVLFAVNTIVAPKFAALYAQNQLQELSALARNAAKFMTLVTAPVLLLFIVVPAWILGLYGPEFTSGAPALSILAVGQFVNVVTGSVGYLLIMTGHEKLMRNNIIVSAALNLVLNVVLIENFGIIGAAAANAISVAFMNLVSAYLVYRKLSIFTIPLPKKLFNYAK